MSDTFEAVPFVVQNDTRYELLPPHPLALSPEGGTLAIALSGVESLAASVSR